MNETSEQAGTAEVGRCGDQAPAMVLSGFSPVVAPICVLPAGHAGWHRADDGSEWNTTYGSPRLATMDDLEWFDRLWHDLPELADKPDVLRTLIETHVAAKVAEGGNHSRYHVGCYDQADLERAYAQGAASAHAPHSSPGGRRADDARDGGGGQR